MAVSEDELLRRYVREGDADAFRALVETHQDMVFSACKRILRNAADAEDAAQNAFFQFARKAPSLRPPVAGWLHCLAVHEAIDVYKRRAARNARELKAVRRAATTADSSWHEIRGELDGIIAELPDRFRTPVVLHYLEGRTQEEIAARLGVTRSAISKRLAQGIELIRKRLVRRGVIVAGAALGGLIVANGAEAAPPSLVAAAGKIAAGGLATGAKTVGVGVIGLASVTKIGIITALAASAILAGGITVQSIRAQVPAKLEIQNSKLETNPKSKIQNPKSDLPTADEIFAELSRRAQNVKGLTYTLDVRPQKHPSRRVIEFRPPDLLRCEVTYWPAATARWSPQELIESSPVVSVVTPTGRWTYFPQRDEVADGIVWRRFGSAVTPWASTERLLAAQLAPAAFYKDCSLRKVFRDKLDGKDCYLVLLGGDGKRPERLWIDAEKWAVVRLEGNYEPVWLEDENETVFSRGVKEVAPGLWLPASIIEQNWEGVEQATCREITIGEIAAKRFELPKDKPYVVRPANLKETGAAVDVRDHLHEDTYPFVAAMRKIVSDSHAHDQIAAELEGFIEKNPRIRAGYYELANEYARVHRPDADVRALYETALRYWPDDPALKQALFWTIDDATVQLKMAKELAGQLPLEDALILDLAAQTHARMIPEARNTAAKLIELHSGRNAANGDWMYTVLTLAAEGGWKDDLRKECEQHAAGQPPSEAHLALLNVFLSDRVVDAEKIAFCAHVADLAARPGVSPELALSCAHMLLSCAWHYEHQTNDVTQRARFFTSQNGSAIFRIYAHLLDSLPEEEYAARMQAMRDLESWPLTTFGTDTAPGSEERSEAVAGMAQLIEQDLTENEEKLTNSQRLWRYRVIAQVFGGGSVVLSGSRKALPFLQKAVELAPEDVELRLGLADSLAFAGRSEDAEKLCAALLQDHPARPEVLVAYLWRSDSEWSREAYSKATEQLVACAPMDEGVRFGVVHAYAKLGRLDDVNRYMNQRINMFCREDGCSALDGAAYSLMKAGDPGSAVEAWVQAIRWGMTGKPRAGYERDSQGVHVGLACQSFIFAPRDYRKDRDWTNNQWIPAIRKAISQYDKEGTEAQRAALRYALAYAFLKTDNPAEARNQLDAAMKLWTWPREYGKGDWFNELVAVMPPDPAAELKKLVDSGKVVWKKDDPFDKNLLWVNFEDHLTGFNNANGRQLEFDFDLPPYQTSGAAFAADRIYVGTSKGIVVYSRRDGFWYRLAAGGTLIDAPVTEIELTKEGELRVTIAEKDQAPRRFVFTPKSGKWREQSGGSTLSEESAPKPKGRRK